MLWNSYYSIIVPRVPWWPQRPQTPCKRSGEWDCEVLRESNFTGYQGQQTPFAKKHFFHHPWQCQVHIRLKELSSNTSQENQRRPVRPRKDFPKFPQNRRLSRKTSQGLPRPVRPRRDYLEWVCCLSNPDGLDEGWGRGMKLPLDEGWSTIEARYGQDLAGISPQSGRGMKLPLDEGWSTIEARYGQDLAGISPQSMLFAVNLLFFLCNRFFAEWVCCHHYFSHIGNKPILQKVLFEEFYLAKHWKQPEADLSSKGT